MHRPRTFPYLYPFFLIPCGIILLAQGCGSVPEAVFSVNLLCGGIVNIYLVVYGRYCRKKGRQIERDPGCVYWLNMFTLFQPWPLIPLYMHLPPRWADRIGKLCKWLLILIGIYLGIFILISMFRAIGRTI